MDYDEFVIRVAERRGTDVDAAREIVNATLTTLGERVSPGQAEDLADALGGQLGARVLDRAGDEATGDDREAFVRKVAGRQQAGRDVDETRADIAAVVATLEAAVGAATLRETGAQLPSDFVELLPHADSA